MEGPYYNALSQLLNCILQKLICRVLKSLPKGPKKAASKFLKKGFGTIVSLWILRNILQLFYRNNNHIFMLNDEIKRTKVSLTINPLSVNIPHKLIKRTQTIRRGKASNCLSVGLFGGVGAQRVNKNAITVI